MDWVGELGLLYILIYYYVFLCVLKKVFLLIFFFEIEYFWWVYDLCMILVDFIWFYMKYKDNILCIFFCFCLSLIFLCGYLILCLFNVYLMVFGMWFYYKFMN